MSETPACLGRRFWLAEGASQKPFDGISTRGSQRPDDSQGRAHRMEQEHGAFKVKSVRMSHGAGGEAVGGLIVSSPNSLLEF